MVASLDHQAEASGFSEFCHDVRQYVAAGLLLTRLPGDDQLDPELRRRLGTLDTILEQISAMVSAELEGEGPQQWLVDLVALVDECVRVVQLNHEVQVAVDAAGSAVAYGDPVLMKRAVTNVLDNASRASGPEGAVSVRISSDANEATVEVADEGPGWGTIPSVHGHGLSVVDRALQACAGRMEIRSGPRRGTTVRLVVPAEVGRAR